MFDWFWDFLYGISKSIFRIIDGLMSCANKLCGIETIQYQGVDIDFVSFLLQNKNITYGFVGAVIIGIILTFIFGVAAIIRAIVSEKSHMTPAQVTVKVGKTLLTFLVNNIAMISLSGSSKNFNIEFAEEAFKFSAYLIIYIFLPL